MAYRTSFKKIKNFQDIFFCITIIRRTNFLLCTPMLGIQNKSIAFLIRFVTAPGGSKGLWPQSPAQWRELVLPRVIISPDDPVPVPEALELGTRQLLGEVKNK